VVGVDSGSRDPTVEIACERRAHVAEIEHFTFGGALNFWARLDPRRKARLGGKKGR